MADKKSGASKKKGGNRHAYNARRKERKYGRKVVNAQAGKCGSSFCTKATGCNPWK